MTPRTTGTEAAGGLAPQLLDSLDFGLLALDGESHVLYVNRKASEILGTPAEEFLGRPAGELLNSRTPGFSFWSLDQIDPEEAGTREIMLEHGSKEFLLEARWLTPAETEGPIATILAFDDVTETVGEVEFQRRVDRFASVGDLSAVIAHEIRNPPDRNPHDDPIRRGQDAPGLNSAGGPGRGHQGARPDRTVHH